MPNNYFVNLSPPNGWPMCVHLFLLRVGKYTECIDKDSGREV